MNRRSRELSIISACSPAADSEKILLPKDAPWTGGGRRLLVRNGNAAEILKPGVRADTGTGACVSADTLAALGGDRTRVSCRKIGFFELLWRKKSLALQLLIAILTLVGAGLSAYGTWVKSSAEAAGYAHDTATIVFVVAALLAVAKFFKDYSEI